MRIWRICKAAHAATAFSGEGAVLYPGHWHHAGTPVVYCSESRALAALEQLVNLDRNRLPPNFVCFGVEVPPGVGVARVSVADLPSDWRAQPRPWRFGTSARAGSKQRRLLSCVCPLRWFQQSTTSC